MALTEKFQANELFPGVIDEVPEKLLKVKYENEVMDPGNELTQSQIQVQPQVQWETDSAKKLHLLILLDPDVPNRETPDLGSYVHWAVGNIPGTDLARGDVLATYNINGYPGANGLHRFVFLVYEQPKDIFFDEVQLWEDRGSGSGCGKGRGKFDVKNFAFRYKLGQPVAGNFFQFQCEAKSVSSKSHCPFRPGA